MRFVSAFAVLVLAGSVQMAAVVVLPMPAFTKGAVQRAVDIAVRKLAVPACRDVYKDFPLPDTQTPRTRLDSLGLEPETFVQMLVFVDGSGDPLCRTGDAGLLTRPGSRLIRVCPRFADFQLKHPGMSGVLIIHESLHSLGLGENPPTSSEITQRIERRCWKDAATSGERRLSSQARLTPAGGSD